MKLNLLERTDILGSHLKIAIKKSLWYLVKYSKPAKINKDEIGF